VAQAKRKEAVDSLGWEPTVFEDSTEGLDRGDGTDTAEASVQEEARVSELGDTESKKQNESTEEVRESEVESTGESAENDEAQTEDVLSEEVSSDPEPPKEHMIPKNRLDQEVAKRRQLEKRLQDLEAAQKTAEPEVPAFDFDQAEKDYMDAILEGESEKAQRLRKEIRVAERTQMEAEFNAKMQNTQVQTRAQINLENEVKRLTTEFPELDVNSEHANEELINETNELMGAFIHSGYDPVDAIQKAVGYTRKTVGINATGPVVVPDLSSKKAPKQGLNTKKKLEAASKQPPKLTGESKRAENNSSVGLSDADFAKLDQDTLKKLRGDFG